MKCAQCDTDTGITVEKADGKQYCFRCCNPLRLCPSCRTGQLVSKPTPNWMNRWVCDHCGKNRSR